MVPEPLNTFEIVPDPGAERTLRVEGSLEWIKVIRRAFPQLSRDDAPAKYEALSDRKRWRMPLRTATDADVADLNELLRLLQNVLFLKNALDECFALAWHSERDGVDATGQPHYSRTSMGELVNAAKPYNRDAHAGNEHKATELASHLIKFVKAHPTFRRAGAVVAVPPSNPNKPFDLPRLLAQTVARSTGKADYSNALTKIRITKPMKELGTAQKKQNILGAFKADGAIVRDQWIILIDDLYGSGSTIIEAGRTLKAAGASLVLGLTATKNLGNK
ncbi:MAG: ComF family protein [Phycisphaerales bacterium]